MIIRSHYLLPSSSLIDNEDEWEYEYQLNPRPLFLNTAEPSSIDALSPHLYNRLTKRCVTRS